MTVGDDLAWIEVTSREELQDWLSNHHQQQAGIWLVTYKKVALARHVDHDTVLDLLTAYGWTDGIARRIDEQRTRQLVSPRRTAAWAKSYKDRALRLIERSEMAAPGLAAVENARASGAWDAMNDVDALKIPADLAEALTASPSAAEHFHRLAPSTRRSILRWIATAKQPGTRDRRITATVSEAAKGRAVKSHG